jgi:hypothetical protein
VTLSLPIKRQLWAIFGFAVAVLVLMASLRSDYFELVLTQVLLWAMMSLAWNILCGSAAISRSGTPHSGDWAPTRWRSG